MNQREEDRRSFADGELELQIFEGGIPFVRYEPSSDSPDLLRPSEVVCLVAPHLVHGSEHLEEDEDVGRLKTSEVIGVAERWIRRSNVFRQHVDEVSEGVEM